MGIAKVNTQTAKGLAWNRNLHPEQKKNKTGKVPAIEEGVARRILAERRSSNTQEEYVGRLSPEIIGLAEKMPPMHPECRLSINLPAYREGKNIYRALYEFTVRQKTADGKTLDPNAFEVNVLLNRPNVKASFDAETRSEIQRFQRDYPEYHVNLAETTFDFSGRPVMGKIYKTLADLAVVRNTKRADGINKERLILRTGGADAREKNPQFLSTVMEQFNNPKIAVYKSESMLPKAVTDKCPLFDVLYRLETGLNRVFTRGQSNIGLGSYTAEIYTRVGGFNGKKAIAEEVDLSTRMADAISKNKAEFSSKKDLKINAVDDPRRSLWALFSGTGMSRRYDFFGDKSVDRKVSSTDWEAKVLKESLPGNMKLTSSNIEREISLYYKQYIKLVEQRSRTLKDYKKNNPGATPKQIRAKTIEIVNDLFEKVLATVGLPKGTYELSPGGKPGVRITNINELERSIQSNSYPDYQTFLHELSTKY